MLETTLDNVFLNRKLATKDASIINLDNEVLIYNIEIKLVYTVYY